MNTYKFSIPFILLVSLLLGSCGPVEKMETLSGTRTVYAEDSLPKDAHFFSDTVAALYGDLVDYELDTSAHSLIYNKLTVSGLDTSETYQINYLLCMEHNGEPYKKYSVLEGITAKNKSSFTLGVDKNYEILGVRKMINPIYLKDEYAANYVVFVDMPGVDVESYEKIIKDHRIDYLRDHLPDTDEFAMTKELLSKPSANLEIALPVVNYDLEEFYLSYSPLREHLNLDYNVIMNFSNGTLSNPQYEAKYLGYDRNGELGERYYRCEMEITSIGPNHADVMDELIAHHRNK